MSVPKVSFFFGAGAELGYGMPLGARFALDIFRHKSPQPRQIFVEQKNSITLGNAYSTSWLPVDYATKGVFAITGVERKRLFEDSLRARNRVIVKLFDHFDEIAVKSLKSLGVTEIDAAKLFKDALGVDFGTTTYAGRLKVNANLKATGDLFSSQYFSAMLDLSVSLERSHRLHKVLSATIQLFVGGLSQGHVDHLNDTLVTGDATPELSVLDELQNLFRVDIGQAGLPAFEAVMDFEHTPTTYGDALDLFADLLVKIVEEVVSAALDYQAFVDSNYGYLFRPREWAKFTKISIFLHTVRQYVSEQERLAVARLAVADGYYHDLASAVSDGRLAITTAGTANYTAIFREVTQSVPGIPAPSHLNGSLRESYDPYRNEVIEADTTPGSDGRFLVPFLFTQSGVKPLTSVDMLRRYVNFADDVNKSDGLVIVGFGFNGDDGHINGLIRNACEAGVSLVICHYTPDLASFDDFRTRKFYLDKLRITDSGAPLTVLPVDGDRMCPGGKHWLAAALDVLA